MMKHYYRHVAIIGGLSEGPRGWAAHHAVIHCFRSNMHLVTQGLSRRQLECTQILLLIPEPEGMLPPEVVVINGTAVRVIWSSPSNPNGVVTEYSIYANDKVYRTELRTPHAFILGDLAPYTVYNIQVCTRKGGGGTLGNITRFNVAELGMSLASFALKLYTRCATYGACAVGLHVKNPQRLQSQ